MIQLFLPNNKNQMSHKIISTDRFHFSFKVISQPKHFMRTSIYFILMAVVAMPVYAESSQNYLNSVKNKINQLLETKPEQDAHKVSLSTLSGFTLDNSQVQELPRITFAPSQGTAQNIEYLPATTRKVNVDFTEAIQQALQRRPEITQSIANISKQEANVDVMKAKYFPQISGGIGTGDLTSGERGRQVVSISATQMMYDFGKVKSSVKLEHAKIIQNQAQTILKIDDIAFQVANAIVNIKRYQEMVRIADQQIKGIARIGEIARLRARAGISSQADPIQAQSNLEAAKSEKIIQETQLRQYQQKLRTLLGYDVSNLNWTIPPDLVKNCGLYNEPEFNKIAEVMVAQTGVEIAKLQKQQSKLSAYPTLNIKGSLSQALNGRNPNNNEDNGFYNSIMLEASSNFYQGGAIASQTRAASYAEEAAKAQVNMAYLDALDEIRAIREEIDNKQKQMEVLAMRRETTIRTKELYQEQYKLGTRTAVDLLNAEQSIHSAAQEIEAARYDIYAAIVKYVRITGNSRELYNLNHITIQGFEVQP